MKIKDDSNEKMYFTIIPNYILNHSTLWDREVYIQMKRITGDEGTCWTSQKTLADQCGISINRLKKSLKYLIANRWIRFIGKKEVGTKGGSQEVNEYKIIDLWKKNMEFYAKGVSSDDTPNTKGVSRDIPKGYHESAKGVSPRDDKEEPLNNIQLNNNNIAKETSANKEIPLILNEFKEINPLIDFGNLSERKAVGILLKEYGFEKTTGMIRLYKERMSDKYCPLATKPTAFVRKMGDLAVYFSKLKEEENNKPKTIVL